MGKEDIIFVGFIEDNNPNFLLLIKYCEGQRQTFLEILKLKKNNKLNLAQSRYEETKDIMAQ